MRKFEKIKNCQVLPFCFFSFHLENRTKLTAENDRRCGAHHTEERGVDWFCSGHFNVLDYVLQKLM